jgi:hypothetical protein
VVQWPTALPHFIDIIKVLFRIVSSGPARETILLGDETIFGFWRRTPETPDGYQVSNNSGGQRRPGKTGDRQMRTLSFILAFAFVLAGPSLAGWSDSSLPGVGTFAYTVTSAPSVVVAAR